LAGKYASRTRKTLTQGVASMLLSKPLSATESKRLAIHYIGEEKFKNGLTKSLFKKVLAKSKKIRKHIKKEERAKSRCSDKYLYENI